MLKYALLFLLFTSMSAMACIELWSGGFERNDINGGARNDTINLLDSPADADIGTYNGCSGTPDAGDVTVKYNVGVWLEVDCDNIGGLEAPSTNATFGIYRGQERVIVRSER